VPHDQEHVLVQQAQAGDRQAFAALVERYWGRIHRWLSRLVEGRPEGEDLTQEVFLKAWSSLRSFQAGTHFRAWLFRIAHNLLVDHQRRSGHAPKASLEETASRQPGPVATLIGRETQTVVQQAVGRLPAPFRAPFLLRTLEEMSYPDIAAAMGLTEETVRWRVCKARRLLLHEIGPYLDRPPP
jgi:RNA polymerase sigma-70 factor, ECF subfamily